MSPILIHFAHKNEAQHFLKFWEASIVDTNNPCLFKSNNSKIYFLISLEGIENTLLQLTYALSYISFNKLPYPRAICNIGIAGCLSNDYNLFDIVIPQKIIRTNSFNKPTDKAFYLDHSIFNPIHDFKFCETMVTAAHSIMDKDEKNELTKLASLVDRELWAVAKVAKHFNLPIASLKLISDFASSADEIKNLNYKSLCLLLFEKTTPHLSQII